MGEKKKKKNVPKMASQISLTFKSWNTGMQVLLLVTTLKSSCYRFTKKKKKSLVSKQAGAPGAANTFLLFQA